MNGINNSDTQQHIISHTGRYAVHGEDVSLQHKSDWKTYRIDCNNSLGKRVV